MSNIEIEFREKFQGFDYVDYFFIVKIEPIFFKFDSYLLHLIVWYSISYQASILNSLFNQSHIFFWVRPHH